VIINKKDQYHLIFTHRAH